MDNDACILAVDLGTSGPKISIVSLSGDILTSTFQSIDTNYKSTGGIEQEPHGWWTAVCSGIRRLVAEHPRFAKRIAAISNSGQWSGTVALDKRGQALAPAIIWMDARGAPHIDRVLQGRVTVGGYSAFKLARWLRRTGGAPGKSGKDSLAHILFIKNQYPEIYRQTYKFLEPKDFLNLRFTGSFAATFDSIALHWVTDNRDIANIYYDPSLARMVGIDIAKFPKLIGATSILGPLLDSVADDLGLSRGIAVVGGSPDLQAAAVGSGAVADFAAHLCIGTSSWLSCHVPYKKADIINNMASLPSALPGRYFIANEQESAGICLDYLWKTFAKLAGSSLLVENHCEHLDKVAQRSVPGSRNLVFTPWLNGERTPVDDHRVRGGFHNLSLQHGPEDIARSVFEGVAYNSRWLLKAVEAFTKKKLDNIHMIGGGAVSALWCQIHADILGRTIRQIRDPRFANTRGAAWIGAMALGLLSPDDITSNAHIMAVYKPQRELRSIYDRGFENFLAFYKSNRKIYRRLNAGQ